MQKRSIADSSKGKLHPIIFINIRKILWTADKDFFASKILTSGISKYFMETRSIQQRNRRLSTVFEKSEGLCFCSHLPSKGSEKGPTRHRYINQEHNELFKVLKISIKNQFLFPK